MDGKNNFRPQLNFNAIDGIRGGGGIKIKKKLFKLSKSSITVTFCPFPAETCDSGGKKGYKIFF